jgi:hypothetical protein
LKTPRPARPAHAETLEVLRDRAVSASPEDAAWSSPSKSRSARCDSPRSTCAPSSPRPVNWRLSDAGPKSPIEAQFALAARRRRPPDEVGRRSRRLRPLHRPDPPPPRSPLASRRTSATTARLTP